MSPFRSLSEAEFQSEARPQLERVFRTWDTFHGLFERHVPQRAILFPIYYKLEEDQLRALLTAARSVGDEGLYISRTERSDPHDPEPQDWFVPSSDISPYADLPLYLETAYYSPGGRWGLLVSRESHALVGGSHSFMDTFMTRIPSTSEQHEEFISNPRRRATSPTGKTADEYTEWLTSCADPVTVPAHSSPDLQVHDFIEYWKAHRARTDAAFEWLPQLLENVYGEREATELLAEHAW